MFVAVGDGVFEFGPFVCGRSDNVRMDLEDVHLRGVGSGDENISLVRGPEDLVEGVGRGFGVGEKSDFAFRGVEVPDGKNASRVNSGKEGGVVVGPGDIHDVIVEIGEDSQRFGGEFGMP